MAISKLDCLAILNDIKESGIDTTKVTKELLSSNSPSLSVIKFINDNRQLDLTRFYEKLRLSYNNKKSTLYKNLVKELDTNNIGDAIITLNSYALQVTLFAKNLEDKQMFYRFARLEEVYRCLHWYSKRYDLTPALNLLGLIRADIKTLETCYR